MDRAYSLFHVKRVDADQRMIEGIATTPTPDRIGDIVEPKGAQFKLPIPLLWQHDHRQPIGKVTQARIAKDGINIRARLAHMDEPGVLKDRLDEAWQSIKSGLVGGLSIGFKSIETSVLENGKGLHFLKWMWIELSAVTIPANADASISQIKSLSRDWERRSEPNQRRKDVKTFEEQLAELQEKRSETTDRMQEMMDGREFSELEKAEADEYDGLVKDLEDTDSQIGRVKGMQRAVEGAKSIPSASEIHRTRERPPARGTQVKEEELEPGIRFARYVKCLGAAHRDPQMRRPIDWAKHLYPQDRLLSAVMKDAVAAGSTFDTTWAGPLVGEESSAFADFVEFLRPQTILGRFGTGGIPSLRRVPFRVALIGQTSGGAGYWVGEGAGKPLTRFDFERTTLVPLKVANIAVITMELARDSSPSAATIVRDQLAAALREELDRSFIDPNETGTPDIQPPSITNGATTITEIGDGSAEAIREDIKAMVGAFVAANNPPTTGVWIMSAQRALAISLLQNPLGQSEFPGVNMNGGTLFGMPVIVSEYMTPAVTSPPTAEVAVLANATDIYLGDEGGINVDMSTEASLQMADQGPGTPLVNQSSTSPAPAVNPAMVSLWQTNSIGFRAERTINWARRRPVSVVVLSGVNWGDTP